MNIRKNIYPSYPLQGERPFLYLLYLLLCSLCSALFVGAFFLLVHLLRSGFPSFVEHMHIELWSGVFNPILVFVVPVILANALYQRREGGRLFTLGPKGHSLAFYGSVIFFIAASFVVGQMLMNLTLLAPIPDFLKGFYEWAELIEKNVNMHFAQSFSSGFLGKLITVFTIVVIAPFTEEFFFRGALQGLLLKLTGRKHLSVWVIAFIFSLIHFQFFGFFSRWFIGGVLGYLAVYGGLRMSIFGHSLYNLIGAIGLLTSTWGADPEKVTEVVMQGLQASTDAYSSLFILVIALAASIWAYVLVRRRYRKEFQQPNAEVV